jgi:hypothetical protein
MIDYKVFSLQYSSIQELMTLSDLEIIIRYHFDEPDLFDNPESRERSIAEWRRIATNNPTEVVEMAKSLREDYIKILKPEVKGSKMIWVLKLFHCLTTNQNMSTKTSTQLPKTM